MIRSLFKCILVSSLVSVFNFVYADLENAHTDPTVYTLPDLTVFAQETANTRPASTYETIVSNLDFDPRIDFQSRNMAEAQGDVSVRGGIFEATGFQVGAATLFDPQTGHYSTELPIAPEMLSKASVYTGADNAFHGFNSTAGTIAYQWSPIKEGGSFTIGGGENQLNFLRFHDAKFEALSGQDGWSLAYEAEYSRSESDGNSRYSDHNFYRTSARIQLVGPNSQTDFFAGYLDKFFGQEGMYAGYGSPETEDIQTALFLVNHKFTYDFMSHWEATTYYRKNIDHYIYDRLSPDRDFIHETEVFSIGLSGAHALDNPLTLNYSLQLTADTIDSSTLENGYFTHRSYYKLTLLPEYRKSLNERQDFTFKIGASYDDTNRNKSELSPIAEISLKTDEGNNQSRRTYLSYAETTQVIGYGAIGGSTESGLYRSNPDLARETSKNLELGCELDRSDWSLQTALFYRWDDDLVDWAYTGVGARSAKNVDIETFGFEVISRKRWNTVEGIASYAYLKKSEDYGDPEVIGSFYALNFPRHRATFGFIHTPNDRLEIRLDNEWRHHSENELRLGHNHALFSHLGISIFPNSSKNKEIFLSFEKPWGDSFQEIPRTPGRGDQFSFGMRSQW
jgi:vitamin B12 transporter